jgi:HD-GYP domain-containing protein (c-di-GMP phosphodiesterase class II)
LALKSLPHTYYQALAEKWLGEVTENSNQLGTVPYQSLLKQTAVADANALSEMLINGDRYFVYLQNIVPQAAQGEYFAVLTPVSDVLAPAIAKVKHSVMISGLILLLMLPLACWYASFIVRPIKQMTAQNQLIKARRYDALQPVPTSIKEIRLLARSISGMASALDQHEVAQEQLLEAFIQLIAEAIDDKSHYTAAHCERVPELAFMLTDAAEASSQAPFTDFRFNNEDERREFRIAAWLHDCGKVTTPEHIVDKGTKLETIYNRIHEIRMRFEVLWRDAEIDYWQQRLTSPQQEAALHAECVKRQKQLQAEFALVAHCNVGSEFLDSADAAELQHIGQRRWQRHFDNRLGLSEPELARYPENTDVLPVTETLLADRPEHILHRAQPVEFDSKLGIKMQVPEYLYNRGELHNLLICRGTLTAEDRFKINEHIISTIKILDKLPLPPELAKVPRYASTHHETLIGTGYPRGLTAEDLSIPERIMVLADIFEALTASDRPYKKAKPVSVAIAILHKMVEEQHVDADVFELFLTSGVYLQYARRFLPPEQIDAVDISNYVR